MSPFQTATRRKFVPYPTKSKGLESPLKLELSKAGILGALYLVIRGSLTGTLSALNPLGKSSIIRQVRGFLNTGIDLFQFSGAQYHYLIRDHIEDYKDPVPDSDARSAVAAGAYNLDMMIPIAISAIDPRGLINLQTEKMVMTVTVEFETDTVIATGITAHTCDVTPGLELFTLPPKDEDKPAFNTVHQIMAETRMVAGAGDIEYPWPVGNVYMQMLHGLGFAVAGADGWTKALVRELQTDRVYEYSPIMADREYARWHGRARLPGTIPIDLVGSDGLGLYGGDRDLFFSSMASDLKTIVTATGNGTLHSVRRQIVAVA
jgi:hypothetical protein